MTDWVAGDRCVCVSGPPWRAPVYGSPMPGPYVGQILIVEEVICEFGQYVFLGFAQWRAYYFHEHFRRIAEVEPDAEDEVVIAAYRGDYIRRPEPVR